MVQYGLTVALVRDEVSEPSAGGEKVETGRQVEGETQRGGGMDE